MATTDVEIDQLRVRVSRLEGMVRELTWRPPPEAHDPNGQTADPDNADTMRAWLRAMGLTRDPTVEEIALAAEWDELPEAEKEAHIRLMDSLVLDPPLSKIIAEGRR